MARVEGALLGGWEDCCFVRGAARPWLHVGLGAHGRRVWPGLGPASLGFRWGLGHPLLAPQCGGLGIC